MFPAAVTADPFGLLVAFGAGILSFLSPCVLPLVPGYLSMVSGLSASEVGLEPSATPRPNGPLLRGILMFIGGFTLVFVILGATASGLGHLLFHHRPFLADVGGAVLIAFGLLFFMWAAPASLWEKLGPRFSSSFARVGGEWRLPIKPSSLGPWAAPVLGMAFAVAWTPCSGPVLAAVLGLASNQPTLVGGVLLLAAYSLGIGVPFAAVGMAAGRLTAMLARARRVAPFVNILAGAILIAFGVLLIAGQVGWLNDQVTTFLNHVGLHRLTVS